MKRRFALIALLALPLAAQEFPQGIAFRMNGMDKAAVVTREANGIPHVFAQTKHDLYFVNGWLHASDRFFQMDTLRHIGSGTFAEMVGAPALATDVQLRTFGLRRAADLSLAAYSADTKAIVDAYTAGVNQWLQTHQLPVEYGLLGIGSVDPWSDTDTVTIGKLLAFQLSFDLSDDIDRTTALVSYQIAGQAVGFNGQLLFADLWRTNGFDPAATIPDATGGPAAKGLPVPALDTSWIKPETVDLLNRWIEQTKDIPIMASFHADQHAGSNEWAIAASNSTTGAPLLANDPHLPLTTPSTFYPISLHQLGGTNVAGMGFPGTPGVIQGQNEHLTWGSTVHPMDVTDAYQETIVPDPTSPSQLSSVYKGQKEKIQIIPQVFRVRVNGSLVTADPSKVPAATLIIPRHGPIISLDAAHGTAVSVQYTGFYATHELEALLGFDDAKTLDDFKAALQLFDFGSQNWAVASTDGHIAYFTSGELPIREDLQAGTVTGLPPYFIRNGSGGNEWMATAHPQPNQATPFEILPYSEMPQVIDPANGFFVNANNDPTGQTRNNNALDTPRAGGGILYLNPGYSSLRAGRITQLVKARLANGGKISPDDMKSIQADNLLYDAEFFVPFITQALKNAQASGANPVLASFASNPAVVAAVTRLSNWNLTSPTGIPQGYDASERTGDKNGQLSTPTQAEVDNSVGATIYSLWRGQFIKNTIDVPLDKIGLPKPSGELPLSALRSLLQNYPNSGGQGAFSGVPFFNVPGVTDPFDRRDILILKSVADALTLAASDAFAPAFAKSTDLSNYQWGKLHRIVFTHYIGFESIGDVAGPVPPSLPGLPGISRQGGFQTVDAASHDVRAASVNGFMFGSGPNRRYVGDVQPGGIRGQSSLPGGVSGTPGSPFSTNLLLLWLTNDTFPVVNDTSPRLPWLR